MCLMPAVGCNNDDDEAATLMNRSCSLCGGKERNDSDRGEGGEKGSVSNSR